MLCVESHARHFVKNLVKEVVIAYNKSKYFMAWTEAIKTREDFYTVENAMDTLLSKLDEALDDVEHGRVLDEAELWDKEIYYR